MAVDATVKYVSFLLIFLFTISLNGQRMNIDSSAFCDPETGLCTPASISANVTEIEYRDDEEIIYVGDPMCSWCWGISPALNRLQVAARRDGIPYRIIMGGLRPGAAPQH